MKSISKLLLSLAFILLIGISAKAQDPSFIVDWNPCELQVTGCEYHVQYAIYNTTTQSFEIAPYWYLGTFLQTADYGQISIDNWDCTQNDTKPYLYLFVHVELRKGAVVHCSGDARSSLLRCDQLYNNATTITVNMDY